MSPEDLLNIPFPQAKDDITVPSNAAPTIDPCRSDVMESSPFNDADLLPAAVEAASKMQLDDKFFSVERQEVAVCRCNCLEQ